MEFVTVNLQLTKARRVERNGRWYLVAKATTIVPGVLNGSQGALFYPPKEIAASSKSWNGIFITVYHPMSANGGHVSAKTPGILERQGVGRLRATRFNGKLTHEAWFDEARTRAVDERVYNALIEGRPMELSTGLYTDNDPAQGSYNGRSYDYVARNYRPDHLAVLPDQTGACSINDGCGLNVNQDGQSSPARFASGEHKGERINMVTNCPHCGGAIKDNMCSNCGVAYNTRRSLWQHIGAVLGFTSNDQPRHENGQFLPKKGAATKQTATAAQQGHGKHDGDEATEEEGDHDDDDLEEIAAKRGMSVEELKKSMGTRNELMLLVNGGPGSGPHKGAGKSAGSLSDAHHSTAEAHKASKAAEAAGVHSDAEHNLAADLHKKAAKDHADEGHAEQADYHLKMAKKHREMARNAEKDKSGQAPDGDAPAELCGKQTSKDGRALTELEEEDDDDFWGGEDYHHKGPTKERNTTNQAFSGPFSPHSQTGAPMHHQASKNAAQATLHTEHDKAQKHSLKAMKASKDGDSEAAAGHHVDAAELHENEATDARKSNDHAAADDHDRAAALHRKAASMHAAVRNASNSNTGGQPMTRQQLLAKLTANCKCDKDRAALNSLSDETLLMVANAPNFSGKSADKKTAKRMDDKEDEEDGDDENAEDPDIKTTPKLSGNMSPADRRTIEWARKMETKHKRVLVNRLVGYLEDAERRQVLGNKLMKLGMDDLQERVDMMPPQEVGVNEEQEEPMYFGQQGGAVNQHRASEPIDSKAILPLPTMNYKELAQAKA